MQRLIVMLAMLFSCAGVVHAQERIALVVGNGGYEVGRLKNPVNDANDVAAALRDVGFTVTVETDITRASLRKAIREFGNRLGEDDVGLFYFAGHGVQVEGVNYLLPIGADIASEDEVPDEAVSINSVLRKMTAANNLSLIHI